MDFLRRCLDWDPDTRLTPEQAFKHTWLKRRQLPQPPTTATGSISLFSINNHSGLATVVSASITTNQKQRQIPSTLTMTGLAPIVGDKTSLSYECVNK